MGRNSGVGTVLIVDEPALAEVHAHFLEETFEVITATNGNDALELIDEGIDIVLLERRLPDMSGDEVLSTLRGRGYEMPVGMISATYPDTDILDLPVDDYITKPLDSRELREVAELLAIRTELDEESRKLFNLIAKKTALENADTLDRDQSESFQQLLNRMETVQANETTDIETLIAKRRHRPVETKQRAARAENTNSR